MKRTGNNFPREYVACVLILITSSLQIMTGCVTSGEVYRRTDKMLAQLETMREAATICAPKEYAKALANTRFARTESSQGDTYKAKVQIGRAHV